MKKKRKEQSRIYIYAKNTGCIKERTENRTEAGGRKRALHVSCTGIVVITAFMAVSS